MINGPDGKKLSKRHGAVSVTQYRDEGFLPEALLNYLARLGWSHGDDEIFSLDDLVAKFDIDAINKSAASFNRDKLLWVNQHYLQHVPASRLIETSALFFAAAGLDATAGPPLDALLDTQRTRARTLIEMVEKSAPFFGDEVMLDADAARKHLGPDTKSIVQALQRALSDLPAWEKEALHACVEQVAAELGVKLGQVAQPLRVAVTGGTASPAIDVTLALLGRSRTLQRLAAALAAIPD